MSYRRIVISFLLSAVLLSVLAPVALGAVLPPSLTVVVNFPPGDLVVSIRFADGHIEEAWCDQVAWEARYGFGWGMLDDPSRTLEGAVLVMQSRSLSFECPFPTSRNAGTYTLHLSSQSVTEGESPLRYAVLIGMRVLAALIIEGLVLLLFRYKAKATWIAVGAVNLVTLSAIYFLMTGPYATWDLGIAFLGLIGLGGIVLPAEMIAYILLLKEHKKARAVLYALAANAASLLLGLVLLFVLPI